MLFFRGTDSAVVTEKFCFWLKFQKRRLESVNPQEGHDFQLIIKLWFEGMVEVFSELSNSHDIILRYKNILNNR